MTNHLPKGSEQMPCSAEKVVVVELDRQDILWLIDSQPTGSLVPRSVRIKANRMRDKLHAALNELDES